MSVDTQVLGSKDDSKDNLDALFQSLSPPRYDTPSPPEYERAAGAFNDILQSEQGQRTLRDEVAKLGESAEDIDISFKKIARGLDRALKTVSSDGTGAKVLRELGKMWQEHHEVRLFPDLCYLTTELNP